MVAIHHQDGLQPANCFFWGADFEMQRKSNFPHASAKGPLGIKRQLTFFFLLAWYGQAEKLGPCSMGHLIMLCTPYLQSVCTNHCYALFVSPKSTNNKLKLCVFLQLVVLELDNGTEVDVSTGIFNGKTAFTGILDKFTCLHHFFCFANLIIRNYNSCISFVFPSSFKLTGGKRGPIQSTPF